MFSPIFTVLLVATVIYSTTGSLSLKRNAVLLQILHNLKVHTLQFDVKFQRKHKFTHIAGMWKTRGRRFPKEVKSNGGKSIWNFLFQLKNCSWVWSAYFFLGTTTQTETGVGYGFRGGHSVRLRRPTYRRRKWLSSPSRKVSKMRWCSILMQQWITRNYRQANSSRAFLLSNHPVYYSVLRLTSRDFMLPPRCSWDRSFGEVERLW